MNIYIILGIMFIHWVADFVLQTDKQARGKSKNWGDLLGHTSIYTSIWLVPLVIYGVVTECGTELLLFLPITFLVHTFTDYYTSRVNARLYEENRIHDFFVSVGFDQWLHQVQLLFTFYLLT